ncbi:MAG: hypothetical protein KY393_06425 [Actinobacteria bacterium]|nr:hypothetical protein [Actinomycetota bacterium]
MSLSPPLPRLTAEQSDLLGLGPAPEAMQLNSAASHSNPGSQDIANPNQLCLTVVQQVLTASTRSVRQPALLDDPPVWETGSEPKARPRRRIPRPGAQNALSPGQMSLF